MIKYSRQRESIVNFLASRTDHPTAETIYQNKMCIRDSFTSVCMPPQVPILTKVSAPHLYSSSIAIDADEMCIRDR